MGVERALPRAARDSRYLEHVAERFDLKRDITFGTRVDGATFDETTEPLGGPHRQGRGRHRALSDYGAVGSAVGRQHAAVHGHRLVQGQVVPHRPMAAREGRLHGQAGRRHRHRRDRGAGDPADRQEAKHLTVFQRTPNFCVRPATAGSIPEVVKARKADYDGIVERIQSSFFGFELNFIPKSALETTPEEREREFEHGGTLAASASGSATTRTCSSPRRRTISAPHYLHRKIRATVNDPEIAEKLIPKAYAYGTKRQPLDTNYYETFNKRQRAAGRRERRADRGDHAEGHPRGGKEYELDIIVFATGFDAMTGPLKRIEIRGRGGQLLREKWEEGPHTYLGLTIAGFPNLFTITGPQSPSVLSNMPVSIEQHVEWITDCIAHMRRTDRDHHRSDNRGRGPVDSARRRDRQHDAHARHQLLVHGGEHPGKPRRFLPYLARTASGPYRQKCNEIAAQGYEGFALGSRRCFSIPGQCGRRPMDRDGDLERTGALGGAAVAVEQQGGGDRPRQRHGPCWRRRTSSSPSPPRRSPPPRRQSQRPIGRIFESSGTATLNVTPTGSARP